MALISRKSTTVSDHLNRASFRKHSGIHTVTSTLRTEKPEAEAKRPSPFGEIVYGEGVGTKPTAYKPIFSL